MGKKWKEVEKIYSCGQESMEGLVSALCATGREEER